MKILNQINLLKKKSLAKRIIGIVQNVALVERVGCRVDMNHWLHCRIFIDNLNIYFNISIALESLFIYYDPNGLLSLHVVYIFSYIAPNRRAASSQGQDYGCYC